LQLDLIEHQLCVLDEQLGTLNARLSTLLRPVNVPVSTAREQVKQDRMNSALTETLATIAERLEMANKRLSYTIEEVDL